MRTVAEMREASRRIESVMECVTCGQLAADLQRMVEVLRWCQGERSELVGQLLVSAAAVERMRFQRVEVVVHG